MYKIKDLQNSGFFEKETFNTKEEVRQRLIAFHEIDWEQESEINDWTVEQLLDYGDWELAEIK
jgi:hypothetical protein